MSRRQATKLGAPRGDGAAFIVVLLSLCLILVATLTWQAYDAARSHRAVAEDVLRDYARLAADELVRRSTSEIGFYGYYKLMGALRESRSGGRPTLPSREALVADADARMLRALPLARYFFQLIPGADRLDVAGWAEPAAGPSPAVESWLRSQFETLHENPEEAAATFVGRHEVIDGVLHSAVLALHESEDEGQVLIGFEVDRSQLAAWFETVLGRGPLLPESLTKAAGDARFLSLKVTDRTGRDLFRAGRDEQAEPAILSVDAPFGDRYQGVLEGTTARVSLYPEAADQLVIGGLPGSRLPTLIGLLLLAAGLLIAAIVQLQRSRALARLRSDFVSRVSHELRTPLTQIRMFAETLILGRVRSEQERHRSLAIIDREARRLSHLVENILQFSRTERGVIQLAPRPRELAPLVRALVRDFVPVLGDRQVSFVFQPEDAARVAVDEDAMRQVLLNLLDNAVKYGPATQQIRIGVECGGDGMVRLSVDDQGPGVPAPDRQRVWRSFHRLERDRRSAVAGTGIGLAVVRELVALHGGRVRVEAGDHGGARFVVELPRVDDADADTDADAGVDVAAEVPA